MADQILSSATSALTGEVVRLLVSGLAGRLDRRTAAAEKKLRRLQLLLFKIHSAVEASEKHTIENTWLLKWRDTLKEAAAEGDEVLAGFKERQRASTDDAARGPGDDDNDARHQQEQERPSSSSSTSALAAAARNDNAPPSGSTRSTGGATETRLFSTGEGMERLNSAVERLEELSPEIGMFLKLLKLEILTPEQTTAENRGRTMARGGKAKGGSRRSSRAALDLEISTPEERFYMENTESDKRLKSMVYDDGYERKTHKLFGFRLDAGEPGIAALAPAPGTNNEEGSEESCRKTPMDETADATTQEEKLLIGRLEEAFAAICRSVELANGRDLRDREWLARWASILREAKEQGSAVLGALEDISARRSATVTVDIVGACEQGAEWDDDREDSELARFVCGMESLAGEVDYFAGLAGLCPSY